MDASYIEGVISDFVNVNRSLKEIGSLNDSLRTLTDGMKGLSGPAAAGSSGESSAVVEYMKKIIPYNYHNDMLWTLKYINESLKLLTDGMTKSSKDNAEYIVRGMSVALEKLAVHKSTVASSSIFLSDKASEPKTSVTKTNGNSYKQIKDIKYPSTEIKIISKDVESIKNLLLSINNNLGNKSGTDGGEGGFWTWVGRIGDVIGGIAGILDIVSFFKNLRSSKKGEDIAQKASKSSKSLKKSGSTTKKSTTFERVKEVVRDYKILRNVKRFIPSEIGTTTAGTFVAGGAILGAAVALVTKDAINRNTKQKNAEVAYQNMQEDAKNGKMGVFVYNEPAKWYDPNQIFSKPSSLGVRYIPEDKMRELSQNSNMELKWNPTLIDRIKNSYNELMMTVRKGTGSESQKNNVQNIIRNSNMIKETGSYMRYPNFQNPDGIMKNGIDSSNSTYNNNRNVTYNIYTNDAKQAAKEIEKIDNKKYVDSRSTRGQLGNY